MKLRPSNNGIRGIRLNNLSTDGGLSEANKNRLIGAGVTAGLGAVAGGIVWGVKAWNKPENVAKRAEKAKVKAETKAAEAEKKAAEAKKTADDKQAKADAEKAAKEKADAEKAKAESGN